MIFLLSPVPSSFWSPPQQLDESKMHAPCALLGQGHLTWHECQCGLSPMANTDLQPWRQHPTGCFPAERPSLADFTLSTGVGPDHSGVRASLSNSIALWNASWKCLRTVTEQTGLLMWFRIVYLVTLDISKEEEIRLYQDLYLQVKLKPQASHVTCQLPNNFPASPYSLSSVFIISYLFQLFCCCCGNIRLTVSKTILNFYQRIQGKAEILQKRSWQRLTHLPVLWCTKDRNNLLQVQFLILKNGGENCWACQLSNSFTLSSTEMLLFYT